MPSDAEKSRWDHIVTTPFEAAEQASIEWRTLDALEYPAIGEPLFVVGHVVHSPWRWASFSQSKRWIRAHRQRALFWIHVIPTLVISLEHSHGRRQRIATNLSDLGIPFSFLEASQGDGIPRYSHHYKRPLIQAEIGCYISHRIAHVGIAAAFNLIDARRE